MRDPLRSESVSEPAVGTLVIRPIIIRTSVYSDVLVYRVGRTKRREISDAGRRQCVGRAHEADVAREDVTVDVADDLYEELAVQLVGQLPEAFQGSKWRK